MKIKIPFVILILSVMLTGCSDEKDNTDKMNETVSDTEVGVSTEPTDIEDPVVDGPISPTTGLPQATDDRQNNFTVMIENSPRARPHSGLVDADVVYEMEVEGNITRYLALFHDQIPEIVGPVRSSRHYYLPIAESWNVPYIHFGGSPQAYTKLKSLSVPSIDGIYQGKFFERDNSRNAPHNAYLLTNQLETSELEPINDKFKFDEEATYQSTLSSTTLDITYNSFTQVTYQFDPDTNLYDRSLEGQPQLDRETDEQIKTSNVIVMYASQHLISGDTAGRIEVNLSGEGEATFFFDGQVVDGQWKNEDDNISFYVDNKPVFLNPGKTWIQVVDTEKKSIVSY